MADEQRLAFLLRPLHSLPTADARAVEYLTQVGLECERELACLDGASGTVRLDAARELLSARPLPAARGFSRHLSVFDWADRYRLAAERQWARHYSTRDAHLVNAAKRGSATAAAELERLRAIGHLATATT